MQREGVRLQRRQRRDAKGSAEITHRVEQPRAGVHELSRQRRQCRLHDRGESNGKPNPAQRLRPEQFPERRLRGEIRLCQRRCRHQQEANGAKQARVAHPAHQRTEKRPGAKHHQPLHEHGVANLERVVAAHAAQVERRQEHRAEQIGADDECEHRANREGRRPKRPQIDNGRRRAKRAPEEQHRAGSAHQGPHCYFARGEPVVGRPLLKHVLRRTEEQRQPNEA